MYSPCLSSFGNSLIHGIFKPCFAFLSYHRDVVGMLKLHVKQIHYFILVVNVGLSLVACASNVATNVIAYVIIRTMTL